jgi:cytochrome c biogenesis protein CcmG/thiol:disulfide interchange protein DsbE
MKKKFSKVLNLIMWAFFIWLLLQRLPNWWDAYQLQEKSAQGFSVVDLTGQRHLVPNDFPKPMVMIFWATWCGPCKIELARYQKAIDEKEIPQNQVIAISVQESVDEVRKLVEERKYTFPVYVDLEGQSRQFYNIVVTPTVILIDKDLKMNWVGTGISPLGILRAKNLFKK